MYWHSVHIVPPCQGGTEELENMSIVCTECINGPYREDISYVRALKKNTVGSMAHHEAMIYEEFL